MKISSGDTYSFCRKQKTFSFKVHVAHLPDTCMIIVILRIEISNAVFILCQELTSYCEIFPDQCIDIVPVETLKLAFMLCHDGKFSCLLFHTTYLPIMNIIGAADSPKDSKRVVMNNELDLVVPYCCIGSQVYNKVA